MWRVIFVIFIGMMSNILLQIHLRFIWAPVVMYWMLSAYSWGTIRTRTTNLWTITRPTSVLKERTGVEKNTKRFFRHAVSLWIAAKYTQIHHSLNILNSRILFSPKNTT